MSLDARYKLCKVGMLITICKAKKTTRKQAKKQNPLKPLKLIIPFEDKDYIAKSNFVLKFFKKKC